MVVLKLSETTGGVRAGALDWTGVTIGVGSAVLLPAGVVMAPATALEEEGSTATAELTGAAALDEEGLTATVELAGAAALDEEGLEAPPPVAGEPEILPKVRS
jgi:hypothetical protein